MKSIPLTFLILFILIFAFSIVYAAPYGPTLNEVVLQYTATKNFLKLNQELSNEQINIRLGMTTDDVEKWAKESYIYHITSRKNSIYKFETSYYEPFSLSFDVWFRNGKVITITTYNINDFEAGENELKELKALKPIRISECWVKQNYVDVNSYSNGYDFALMVERNIPQGELCMGSDRANITIGKPGILYPKHVIHNLEKRKIKEHDDNIISDAPDKL